MTGRATAILLLAVLVATGCATAKLVPQRPYATPAADELLALVRHRQKKIRTLNAETRATSYVGSERGHFTVLMLVDRSGRLRFEAEVALQGTVAALATDGKMFSFVDFRNRTARTGIACAASVAQVIRIPLAPREIAAILLGDALVGEQARAVSVGWNPATASDVLALESGADLTWIDLRRKPSGGYEIVALAGQSPGQPGPWRVAYQDHERFEGDKELSLPSLILFAEPGKSFKDGVEIKIKSDRILNAPMAASAFTLAPPAGFPIETIPCPLDPAAAANAP